jgi:hypothetical protein
MWLGPILFKNCLSQIFLEEMEDILLGKYGNNDQQLWYPGEKYSQQYQFLTKHTTFCIFLGVMVYLLCYAGVHWPTLIFYLFM